MNGLSSGDDFSLSRHDGPAELLDALDEIHDKVGRIIMAALQNDGFTTNPVGFRDLHKPYVDRGLQL
jgi:hypothetical protein